MNRPGFLVLAAAITIWGAIDIALLPTTERRIIAFYREAFGEGIDKQGRKLSDQAESMLEPEVERLTKLAWIIYPSAIGLSLLLSLVPRRKLR